MQNTSTLLIIADDLTGAADTAARCHNAGMPAAIAVTPPDAPLRHSALAVSTDSRHLDPAAAARRVHEICAPLAQAAQGYDDMRWYKKIDSTLRGNLGAELDALMALCGASVAVVCPAFPAQRRGLDDGYLVYPDAPQQLHLPTLLRHQSEQSVGWVPLEHVRDGGERLAAQMRMRLAAGHTVLVVDALTEADLDILIEATAMAAPDALFCGSAGLIGALAAQHAMPDRTPDRTPPASTTPGASLTIADEPSAAVAGRILMVVGSGSAMAHAQIHALAASALNPRIICVDHDVLPAHAGTFPETAETAVTLLHLPQPAPSARLDGPDARVQARRLAEAAYAVCNGWQPNCLILVGGDTAIALLTQFHIARLDVQRELLPGMPLTRAELPDGAALHVVLKAGNHGDTETLLQIVDLLRK